MQVYGSPYCTVWGCWQDVLQREGLRAFYRSYPTQLVMNIPFHALHFVTYEHMQEYTNQERHYNPVTHGISGAVAGGVAAGATTPLDVCKTLINTQEEGAVEYRLRVIRGLVDSARTIYEMQGFSGFFKGLQARVLFQMPATAIAWTVYEFFKYTITINQVNKCESLDYLTSTDISKTLGTVAMAANVGKRER